MDAPDSRSEPRRLQADKQVNRDICIQALTTMGLARDPWIARALATVDREAFVPPGVWLSVENADGLWQFVDKGVDPELWARAVWDPHCSVVTQLDDGRVQPSGPSSGDFTSSVSALDVVMRKLHHLNLHPDHRVLEIGYGSGYHTALLCERVSSERVTAVEVDEALATWGASNLKAAGYAPELIHGDGLEGARPLTLFDRVINTASLRRVPFAWIEQTRTDGVILTPFGTAYSNAGLLRLSVNRDAAQGQFVGEAAYMWARSERPVVALQLSGDPVIRPSPIDPAQVLGGTYLQDFAIGLQVPDVTCSHRGEGSERQVQFVDEAGTSATIVNYGDWWDAHAVRSWGPRDLWAEVTAAYTWYEEHDRPHITRFGVTVERDEQRVWLDTPDQLIG
ncbi:hypothetical protein OHS33_28815 [Streptomyces sp. NBC_00536]|uniref:rRNA adenine N-6-methyltransferase family protein n=1 Tax=Streptomyces sp. NBC_00536 TaxID=2975769 RepID=UPI002E7FF513|nr:rRNA adenine N-6-methyltransferase family protein [Streptomyces sp. NBC_00536]WUC81993.1 hypothetical protein OHS33_28815 [Streptomyces sp. NBC_00536]